MIDRRNYRIRPRDADGWRIPGEGTLARRVYDLAKRGLSKTDIARELDLDRDRVGPYLVNLRRPERANEICRDAYYRHRPLRVLNGDDLLPWSTPSIIEVLPWTSPILVDITPVLVKAATIEAEWRAPELVEVKYFVRGSRSSWWAHKRTEDNETGFFMAQADNPNDAIDSLLTFKIAWRKGEPRPSKSEFLVVASGDADA